MTNTGPDRGMLLYERHRNLGPQPDGFELLGRDWDLLEGVFSPSFTPVTGLFTNWIPYPKDGSFLEIGSGAGVTAVIAAAVGGCAVTATDLSSAAVENTRRNALRHGVADRVRVLRSDLFDALRPAEKFDMIYWNSNFVEPAAGFVNETELHHAFFDPAYEAHRRYLRDAGEHLTDTGRLLLGFTNLGNWPVLRQICAEAGREIHVLHNEERVLDHTAVHFQLLELR